MIFVLTGDVFPFDLLLNYIYSRIYSLIYVAHVVLCEMDLLLLLIQLSLN